MHTISRKGLILYLVLEAVLLCLVEIGWSGIWADRIVQNFMYVAILLNAVIVAYHFFRPDIRTRHDPEDMIAYAIFGTAAADFFMTFIGPSAFIPGVILFCVVQVIYGMYLDPAWKWLPVRVIFFALSLIGMMLGGILNLKSVLGILDIILLIVNVAFTWIVARKKTSLLFKIGITLFLCCDVSITIRTMTTGNIHLVVQYLVWLFYIPSQVALTLSYVRESGKVMSMVEAS